MQTKRNGNEKSAYDAGRAGYSGIAACAVICSYADALIEAMRTMQNPARRTYCQQLRNTGAGGAVYRVKPDVGIKGGESVFPKCDVYLQPGKQPTRGRNWDETHSAPRSGACVVLGAGNQPFLSVVDVLTKMFHDNYPVVLKHHDAQVRWV